MERLVALLVLFGIGFLAQFIDGTVGMGYGAFSVSLLIAFASRILLITLLSK